MPTSKIDIFGRWLAKRHEYDNIIGRVNKPAHDCTYEAWLLDRTAYNPALFPAPGNSKVAMTEWLRERVDY